jgi:diaminohydroxyphosphoribosylaminopyrimidine deaminase/5-amino-6-(5-phosphoribosylamino)uracil reductase
MDNNIKYIKRALTLAKKGFGRTAPNPMVGAVIVRDGIVIGEGWHKQCGGAHAEVNAINSASKSTEGATIYVTLEPCSTTGRTPPCTDAIISAKFAKVVIGTLDPNPKHAGRAVKILNNAGIKTVSGIESERCTDLNKAFFHWIQTGTPYVILKMAMTLDGKTATAGGQSKWITGPAARKSVQQLRKWSDAIMVGGETVRADIPSLNVRNSQGNPLKGWKQPYRIVASRSMTPEIAENLMGSGGKVEIVTAESRDEWGEVLKKLGEKDITALLIEGGSELAGSVIEAEIVNEVAFYIAPKILGGKDSKPVIGGKAPLSLEEAYQLKNQGIRKIGDDILITGKIGK